MSAAAPPPSASVGSLARDHGLALLRYAYLLCGDRQRAEDLLQDVLLAMHRRFGDQLTLDNPVAYAHRALANANVSWARRPANRELAVRALPDSATRDDVPDGAERDALWQALRALPARQRTVLVMRHYGDATDVEIAAALGCRRATVRSLAARGLAALRLDPRLGEGQADR